MAPNGGSYYFIAKFKWINFEILNLGMWYFFMKNHQFCIEYLKKIVKYKFADGPSGPYRDEMYEDGAQHRVSPIAWDFC